MIRMIESELAPFPGRFSGSLRDTLGIVIALLFAMTLRIPGISLALALLFLLQRERPGLSLKSALNIFSGAALALAYSLVWVQLTDSSEVARVLGMMLLIFVAAFGMSASTKPVAFTIFGFYGFLYLSLWDGHRSADAIVRSSLYNLASLVIVLLSAVAVEYVFGSRHPASELKLGLQKRLEVLSRLFHVFAKPDHASQSTETRTLQNEVLQYAHAGDRHLNKLYNLIRDGEADLEDVPIGLSYRIGLLTRILEKSALVSLNGDNKTGDGLYFAALAEQCDRLLNSETSDLSSFPPNGPHLLEDIYAELLQYATAKEHGPQDTSSRSHEASSHPSFTAGLFLPDAFVTSASLMYALKLTLAAMVCYVFYNAIAWPGILTCVVTVLFTGLSSTGAMKQKQLYRFAGAAIGGALGIATVSLFFPNMDSITSLIVVVAAVALLSAWILRSPRIGYVGVQIGFAFFLTTLPGFGTATLIVPARDRMIGIAFGILSMWFIFDQLWPVRTSTVLKQVLGRIQSSTVRLGHPSSAGDSTEAMHMLTHLRASVSLDVVTTQQLETAARFDFGREHKRELAASRRLVRQIESAAADFYTKALSLKEKGSSHPR
jgi:multidrug resistance protein MdtO